MNVVLLCVFHVVVVSSVNCVEAWHSITRSTADILAANRDIDLYLTNAEDLQRRQYSVLIGTIFDLGGAVMHQLTDQEDFDKVYDDVYSSTVSVSFIKYWDQPEAAYSLYQIRKHQPVGLATKFKRISSLVCIPPTVTNYICDCKVKEYAQQNHLEHDFYHTLMLGVAAKEYLKIEPDLNNAAQVEGSAATFLVSGKDELRPLIAALVKARLMNYDN